MSIPTSNANTKTQNSISVKNRIYTILLNADQGMTPKQVAEQLKIARVTATKYLAELQIEDKLTVQHFGLYAIYSVKRPDPNILYKLLYNSAAKGLTRLVSGQPLKDVFTAWESVALDFPLPYEDNIPQAIGRPTPQYLKQVIQVVTSMICAIGFSSSYPKVEVVPSLQVPSPMTCLLHVDDPGFIPAGAWAHYLLIADIIQKRISDRAGIPLVFRLAKNILPSDKAVYFELGFVDYYYLDLCIAEHTDTTIPTREYISTVINFLKNFIQMSVREYFEGEINHFECRIIDNKQWESFFAFRVQAISKNIEFLRSFNIQPTRIWVPYVDWPDPPFLILKFTTNALFTFDFLQRIINQGSEVVGFCMYLERIPNGFLWNFREEIDFHNAFSPILDENAMREHYKEFGIVSDEYLSERKKILTNSINDMQLEIPKKQSQRHHKKKNAIKNEEIA